MKRVASWDRAGSGSTARAGSPDSDPRAVVVLVHGVGEHSGRYMNIVGPLVEGGYAVFSYDQRGHGASEGRRVHIDRWSEYRDDLGTYIEMVSTQVPERPVVLYGHSMGSLVVLDYLLCGFATSHGGDHQRCRASSPQGSAVPPRSRWPGP